MAKAILRAAFVLATVALGAGLLLPGCGGKSPDDVVATFNGEPLTLGYLEAKWAKLALNDPAFEPDPDNSARTDSIRHAVLDVIINKELIVDQAFKRKFVDDPSYVEAYEGQKNYRLIELLKNRQVMGKMPEFTEDDLLAHYQYLGFRAKTRHIDIDTEEEGKGIAERLRAGELSFHEAILQFSTHQDRFSGGELGWIKFGDNIKAVEETLFNMEKGDISDPVKTPFGWSVFTVDEIEKEEPDEYVTVRASIENRLNIRSMREIGAAHAQNVLNKYDFEFNWDAAETIVELMPDDMTPTQMRESRTTEQEKPILKFSEEDLGVALYELEGESFTLKDFSDEYDRLHPFARPMKSARRQGVYNWVHKSVVGNLMPREAIAIGLDKDPELIMIMKEFEEQSCIGAVRRAVVDREVQVTEEKLLDWYHENPLMYTLREQVRCKQVVNPEEEKIQEAYRELQAGTDVDSVGAVYSIVYTRQWHTDYFTADSTLSPQNPAIAHVQKLAEIGEFTTPFYYKGYWGIMQLTDRRPKRLMDFEETREKLTKDVREMLSNERLDSLLTEWRLGAEIVIDEKVLRKAEKGPDPTPKAVNF